MVHSLWSPDTGGGENSLCVLKWVFAADWRCLGGTGWYLMDTEMTTDRSRENTF